MSNEQGEKDLSQSNHAPYRSILIFGPPGSGKGTLGKALAGEGKHFHLSSGDIFRGLSSDSPAGKLYQTHASKGHLVPDDVTIQIWEQYVKGLIATNRYFPKKQFLLLDGIPRTEKQVEILQGRIEVVSIIVLEVKETSELIARIKRRAVIEGRMDDVDENVLRTRMEVYQRDTAKLLRHYPKELISTFNAARRPLEVLQDVLDKLGPLLS
jgi:adenylate kinase